MKIEDSELKTLKMLIARSNETPSDIYRKMAVQQYSEDLATKYKIDRTTHGIDLDTGEVLPIK